MAWTATALTVGENILNATASYVDVPPPSIPTIQFTWSATIKKGDYDAFCTRAKVELDAYILKYKDDAGIVATIEAGLNI
mgnify:CR=1 FL=1